VPKQHVFLYPSASPAEDGSCAEVVPCCCSGVCCCSAKTKHLPRDVFGPPAPLEAKATFIAAIVNRAATGANFKNRVNSLYTELQRQQVAGAAVGLGARVGGPLPHLPARPGLGLQQRPGA
jgi:hypothetical protein